VIISGSQSSLFVTSYIETSSSLTVKGDISTGGRIFANGSITCDTITVETRAMFNQDLIATGLLVSNGGNSAYIGSNGTSLTYLTVQNDVLVNGHLTVQNGMTWNGVLSASEMNIAASLTVGGASTVNGASLVNGVFTTHGIASFDSTVNVGTALTVGTSLTVGTDVTVQDSVVAASFCFPDSSCIFQWPNQTLKTVPDTVILSQNVSLTSGEEKILYVGIFSQNEINRMYVELSQTDDQADTSYGVVDSTFITSIKNKAAKIANSWNGGKIENGSVWARLHRYDDGKPLNFICTVKRSA